MRRVLYSILPLLLMFSIPITTAPTQTFAPPVQTLQMINSTHGNALNGQVQVTALPGNCFFPILINITITFTGNTTYVVSLSSFTLTALSFSSVISNSTNFNQVSPNNKIDFFYLLKPPNNVVVLILTFQKICILGSLIQASLIYNDGVNTFKLIS